MSEAAGRPIIAIAMEPRTRADRERLHSALPPLTAEDSTLRTRIDHETGQVIVAGMSELQLEKLVARLFHEFSVQAAIGMPQVIYKEMFTRPADGEGRFVRQSRGRGQYAHARLHLSPGIPGTGYVFENACYGSIPEQFIAPIDEGVRESLARRTRSRYAIDDVRDVRIELYDGSYHDADSSETAFRIAGSMAIDDAASKAAPVLLEPIVRVEVVAPSSDYVGDLLHDISKRRGLIQSLEDSAESKVINACAPLSEMIRYATELRRIAGEHATCSIHFDRYEQFRVRPDIDDDDRLSGVSVPRALSPTRGDSAIALPEPDEPPR